MYSVKAIETGDGWELEVLGCPWYGPNGGKDADGEYFDANTKFHEDKYPLPPVVYYHGFTPEGAPAGEPQYIGKAVSREVRDNGVWYRVVLDRANEYAKRVWEAAKNGLARASSGAVAHLVRRGSDGHLLQWPVAELSLFDAVEGRRPANGYAVALPVMKSMWKAAGLPLPDIAEPEPEPTAGEQPESDTGARPEQPTVSVKSEDKDMEPDIKAAIEAALAERDAAAAKAKEEADIAALKAENEALKKAATEANRLPGGGAPYVTKFNDRKYDNLDADDMAFLLGILDAPNKDGLKATHTASGRPRFADRGLALKSLALKMAENKDSIAAHMGLKALQSTAGRALKSDEIMQQDLSNYGDDWVGVAYSTRLWEAIRQGTFVVQNLPSIEVPAGHESIIIPLESGDPTFYKVAEATSLPTTEATGWPNATITSSQMGTAKATISLAKMGARVLWSGELEEDSLVPFVAQLRRQLERAGAEQMEHAIIDGDTDTTASTNINDIAGTPAGTELFLLVDGFRKLPLITNPANSRDATTLVAADYLETLKLMGVAGKNAALGSTAFIIDPWVHYKSLELPEVLSRDVFSAPTVENGRLVSIWGHPIYTSYFMCYSGVLAGTVTTDAYKLKSQSADGKIDQDTQSDNVDGSILAVRWDQWMLAWRRRMTIETTRIARADTTEIVALARWGLKYRDTEASAISYGVTV